MKQCPKCQRVYRDDTLRFCLDDGVPLVSVGDSSRQESESEPPPTAIMPGTAPPTMQSAAPTVPSYLSGGDFHPGDRRPPNTILTVGVVAIAVLLLALVGIAGYFVMRSTGSGPSANESSSTGSGTQKSSSANRKNDPAAVETKGSGDEITTSEPSAGAPLKITATASSVRLAVQSNTYYPANAIDGKRSTAWIEGVDGPGIGEWIRFDFDREINVHRILIQPGYFKSPLIWAENNRLATVTAQFSDGSSRDLNFLDRMESQKANIGSVRTRWVRLVIKSVYHGTNPGSTDDTALSEVAFEWEP